MTKFILSILFAVFSFLYGGATVHEESGYFSSIDPNCVQDIEISAIKINNKQESIPKEQEDSIIKFNKPILHSKITDYNEFSLLIKMINSSKSTTENIDKFLLCRKYYQSDDISEYFIMNISINMRNGEKICLFPFYMFYFVSNGQLYNSPYTLGDIIVWYINKE